jgi:DME family drug/metabolite transporter
MPQRADARIGLIFVMMSAVLWGTVGVTTKTLYGLADTNSLSIGFFRLAFSVPIIWVVCWQALKGRMFQVTRRDFGLMVLIGLLTAQYQVFYFTAISYLGVAVATLITLCTAPVVVALLSTIFIKERLTWRVIAAFGLALAGTALLIEIQNANGEQSDVLIGVLWALGSAFSYGSVTLLSRSLANRYHPMQPVAIAFSVGAVALLIFAGSTGLTLSYPPTGWLLLLYLGAVPTALAYGLFLMGMRSTPATVASIATLLEPLVSAILAWLIFGERLSPLGLWGAVLLVGAMILLLRK